MKSSRDAPLGFLNQYAAATGFQLGFLVKQAPLGSLQSSAPRKEATPYTRINGRQPRRRPDGARRRHGGAAARPMHPGSHCCRKKRACCARLTAVALMCCAQVMESAPAAHGRKPSGKLCLKGLCPCRVKLIDAPGKFRLASNLDERAEELKHIFPGGRPEQPTSSCPIAVS